MTLFCLIESFSDDMDIMIYISARVFRIRKSEINDTIVTELGDFVTRSSGIVDEWSIFRQTSALKMFYCVVYRFMLLSIIISLLGLLAMSTYYADEKSRDIAVRKVFGGTVDSEAWHSIRDYMILVGVACIIGIPVAVYAAQEYLKDFIYRLEGYWWIFVVSVLLSVAIAFVSVLWQTLKAARTNPAIELKKE